jgi:neutral trehalase
MDFNREVGFDPARIAAESPYRVNDVGIISLLNRASHSLACLCEYLGLHDDAAFLRSRCTLTQRAIGQLWSDKLGQYVSRDAITGELLEVPTHAGFLTWYGKLVEPARDAALQATLRAWLTETPYALPSTRSTYAGFEPARYWRGPIWQHLTSLIAEGLDRYGHTDLGGQLHRSTETLFARSGFFEYYHPITGAGLGGGSFSWTAATYLFWNYIKTHGAHPLSGADFVSSRA